MFFFFKQKTAYEMRISDWSSDVCSSDLGVDPAGRHEVQRLADAVGKVLILLEHGGATHEIQRPGVDLVQIGIAALREGAQQVERRRRLRIGPDLALRIGLAALRLEPDVVDDVAARSEEHTSELQSLMRISYAVFCLKKKKTPKKKATYNP